MNKSYDVDPAFGGPIVKDKLWFWGSVRAQASEQTLAGIYYNLTPTGRAYTPDLTRPADSIERNQNESLRLTWQISPRNKLSLQHQNASQQRPFYGYSLGQLTSAPEAIYYSKSAPMYQSQGGWNSPVTGKLLIEAGVLYNNKDYPTRPQPDNAPEPDRVPRFRHRLQLGQLRQHLRPQRQPQLQHAVRRVVRDRLARDQGRRDVHAPVGLDVVRRRQQRHDAAAATTACRAR